MVQLYDKDILDNPLCQWQQDAFVEFHKMISDKSLKFPCIPAYQGYMLNQMRIGFAEDPRKLEAGMDLADLLSAYGNCSKQLGNYTALIVLFETPIELQNDYTVNQFEQLFWKLLNQVSKRDQEDWPEMLSPDPNDPLWEFCFNNERYFVYCATPAHKNRRSRHFPYFMLAITPRWVLEKFSSSPGKAARMKELIRARLVDYDEVPPHPELKWYGEEDNHEWKQYYLRDDESTLKACPFHYIRKKKT